MSCHGNGECFVQSNDCKYHGKKDKNMKCKYDCELMNCSCCNEDLPEWVLQCNGGQCINCNACDQSNIPNGHCLLCKKKLVPIGINRTNGKQTHTDWKNRKYHKKCWKIMKNNDDNC